MNSDECGIANECGSVNCIKEISALGTKHLLVVTRDKWKLPTVCSYICKMPPESST
jgi:hypothetical protein